MTLAATQEPEPQDLVEWGVREIHAAFLAFQTLFNAISRRAAARFENRDWHGIQADATERLDLYPRAVDRTVARIRELPAERARSRPLWRSLRAAYSARIAGEPNRELAETFFSSVSRRIFATVGVDPEIEYVSPAAADPADRRVFRRFPCRGDLRRTAREILAAYRFRTPYRDVDAEAELIAREVADSLGPGAAADYVETLRPVFFRNKGAYVVGRLGSGGRVLPFVLPLLNAPEGIVLDAVLLSEEEVSIVFSFTRSYFLVETERPRDLIAFLQTILPIKPVEELYISLGLNQHGKRVTYLRLEQHLATTEDRFATAEGEPGMVMLAFTLPSYHVLFKVIRDRFAHPKTTTRRQVRERYRLVFKHDRVGRLVDAQEFEDLKFRRRQFAPELLEELLSEAAETVSVAGDHVVIKHLYTERKLEPLNLFLRQADPAAARHAVLDYGNAIKQLAAANVFPGDFLLKNFGVTRHGRVVFYDYDELCLVTDCRFRKLPPPRDEFEELAAEPWFGVAENDIFPEEFERFIGLSGELAELFRRHHGDLFSVALWRELQERHRAGEILDIFPYPEARRLHRDSPSGAPGAPVPSGPGIRGADGGPPGPRERDPGR